MPGELGEKLSCNSEVSLGQRHLLVGRLRRGGRADCGGLSLTCLCLGSNMDYWHLNDTGVACLVLLYIEVSPIRCRWLAITAITPPRFRKVYIALVTPVLTYKQSV